MSSLREKAEKAAAERMGPGNWQDEHVDLYYAGYSQALKDIIEAVVALEREPYGEAYAIRQAILALGDGE